MVMIIIHIAYITYLVTNDAWHAYDVNELYNIHHGAGRISYFHNSKNWQYCGWLVGRGRGRSP